MVAVAAPSVTLHLGSEGSESQAVTLTVHTSSREVSDGLIAAAVLLERFQL